MGKAELCVQSVDLVLESKMDARRSHWRRSHWAESGNPCPGEQLEASKTKSKDFTSIHPSCLV